MNEILIAGGTGLIGSKLINNLKQKNYKIVLLSTRKNAGTDIETHFWNPSEGVFPTLDLARFSCCFNFCGAGIFDRKINADRKEELLLSRTLPIEILCKHFALQNCKLPLFISASAMGFYPGDCLNELKEDSTAGKGYISELVQKWEHAALSFGDNADKICVLRISNVLAADGGFLSKLSLPIRWFAGAIPGNGKQVQSWIHIDDLCAMLEFAMEHKLEGIFNAAAPEHNTMQDMTFQIAKHLNRPIILPNIPFFALRLVFGNERAALLQSSLKVSPSKMIQAGFTFRFPDLHSALSNILAK